MKGNTTSKYLTMLKDAHCPNVRRVLRHPGLQLEGVTGMVRYRLVRFHYWLFAVWLAQAAMHVTLHPSAGSDHIGPVSIPGPWHVGGRGIAKRSPSRTSNCPGDLGEAEHGEQSPKRGRPAGGCRSHSWGPGPSGRGCVGRR